MNISFSNSKLKKYANNDDQGVKNLGALRHKKYKKRLDQLRASMTLEDVRYQPGRFHELTGDRKGQWACDLDHPYRLIFKPREDPIPTDGNGKYIWVEILGVDIIEIADYH
ncbi:killer suppression protein HigA [Seonamhaeicola sp. S2-3]|uniref:type II toxin-antitoxin system RelE/ParE family toxin n=1 Tax=Seonamhaeicola sp. S2-3 TaxID=1936081 RepID=UPI0009728789|nr:type II toxin-antitoxin system RelE/ParE family toxin [Seonamhaeicola sp. S2-3]APY10274.1 killer suppression protein HigA [Seonamhaeicola sp. S2-3]